MLLAAWRIGSRACGQLLGNSPILRVPTSRRVGMGHRPSFWPRRFVGWDDNEEPGDQGRGRASSCAQITLNWFDPQMKVNVKEGCLIDSSLLPRFLPTESLGTRLLMT